MEESVYYANYCVTNHPSAFVKENMIYLQEIGKQYLFSSMKGKEEKTPSYLFFIINSGRGILEYAGDSRGISAGYCAFLDCRRAYCYDPVDEVLEIQYIRFAGFHMEEIYGEFIQRGSHCFCPYSPQIYKEAWQKIYEIASTEISTSLARDMKMYAALVSLTTNLIKLEGHVSAQWGLKRQNLQNIREYLERHYWERISLDQLAEMFYINKFYLTRLFREEYGISIKDYLIRIRIDQAKKLLRFSNLPIDQVGMECGISNANYFFKVFKKREGISPGSFRRKARCQEMLENGRTGQMKETDEKIEELS